MKILRAGAKVSEYFSGMVSENDCNDCNLIES